MVDALSQDYTAIFVIVIKIFQSVANQVLPEWILFKYSRFVISDQSYQRPWERMSYWYSNPNLLCHLHSLIKSHMYWRRAGKVDAFNSFKPPDGAMCHNDWGGGEKTEQCIGRKSITLKSQTHLGGQQPVVDYKPNCLLRGFRRL